MADPNAHAASGSGPVTNPRPMRVEPYDLFWVTGAAIKRSPVGVLLGTLGVVLVVLGMLRIATPIDRKYDPGAETRQTRAFLLGGSGVFVGGMFCLSGSVLYASSRRKD